MKSCQPAKKLQKFPINAWQNFQFVAFLVWLLPPMSCHSGPWFKKPRGLFAAGSFWKLVALWHPQPSIGLCCCIASYYPELRRIVFGNRMVTFSYNANLQVGPSSSPCAWGWWGASFVRSSSCFALPTQPSHWWIVGLEDYCMVILSRFDLSCTRQTTYPLWALYRNPAWAISAVFSR